MAKILQSILEMFEEHDELSKYIQRDMLEMYEEFDQMEELSDSDNEREMIIHEMVMNGNIKKYLKKNKSQINKSLEHAIQKGDVELAKYLLEEGADPKSYILVDCAITCNRIDILKILIEKGANINDYEKIMVPSYIIAASYGYYEIVKFLLDNGLTVNSKKHDYALGFVLNETVKQYEPIVLPEDIRQNYIKICKLFIDLGLYRSRAISNAIKSKTDFSEIIDLLIEKKSFDYWAFDAAIKTNKISVLTKLIEADNQVAKDNMRQLLGNARHNPEAYKLLKKLN